MQTSEPLSSRKTFAHTAKDNAAPAGIHFPCLFVGISVMLIASVYPNLFMQRSSGVNHPLLIALLYAMSAGLVRGVGYIPHARFWQALLSGWSCLIALVVAVWFY